MRGNTLCISLHLLSVTHDVCMHGSAFVHSLQSLLAMHIACIRGRICAFVGGGVHAWEYLVHLPCDVSLWKRTHQGYRRTVYLF